MLCYDQHMYVRKVKKILLKYCGIRLWKTWLKLFFIKRLHPNCNQMYYDHKEKHIFSSTFKNVNNMNILCAWNDTGTWNRMTLVHGIEIPCTSVIPCIFSNYKFPFLLQLTISEDTHNEKGIKVKQHWKKKNHQIIIFAINFGDAYILFSSWVWEFHTGYWWLPFI